MIYNAIALSECGNFEGAVLCVAILNMVHMFMGGFMILATVLLCLWCNAYAMGTGDLSSALKPVEAFITSDLSRIIMLSGCGLYAWRAWSEGNPMGLVGAGVIALAAQSLFQYIKTAHPLVEGATCTLF